MFNYPSLRLKQRCKLLAVDLPTFASFLPILALEGTAICLERSVYCFYSVQLPLLHLRSFLRSELTLDTKPADTAGSFYLT